jgi:hypothetical protein
MKIKKSTSLEQFLNLYRKIVGKKGILDNIYI